MPEILLSVFCLFVIFWIGVWRGKCHNDPLAPNKAGTIVVNTTNPNKDTIRIELDIPITTMMESDQLVFDVRKENMP